MRRLAHWSFLHRRLVLAGWVGVLALTFFVGSTTGSNYATGTKLSGTESATAQTLLQQAAPSVSGDTERIVFATKHGQISQPAIRRAVGATLAKVARLPDVTGVTSPYTAAGAKQLSRDGHVAFATVNFSKDANKVNAAAANKFVKTARAANGHGLQVEVLGEIAASTNPSSSSGTMFGIAPALIGFLGHRTLTRKQRRVLAAGDFNPPEASERWARWAELVQTHRLGLGVAALAVMLALAVPASSLRLGIADFGTDPTTTTTTTHRAYELLASGFGPGFSGPLELVAPIQSPSQRAAFVGVVKAAGRTRGVVATTAPQFLPSRRGHPGVAVAQVYPAGSPQDASTSNLITTMRHQVIPNALHGRSATIYVGGQTALADDEAAVISSKLPVFVGMVVALSFLLLMVVFRSLLIPATAAVMNLLSAGAAFGVITAVFEKGWLDSLVGVSRTGPISPLVPILMFAVLFGLSMDYEVFLVSRIQEEWLKTRDNARAIDLGQAITGRTITALATIMVVVFASFTLSTDRTIKLIGLGMAAAILVDALIVRTVLVPAIMHTFGRRNWYLPSWLDRRLPHLEIEEKSPTRSEDREPVLARSA
jgi:uncharacterized membrane protein YdfJ with MMPL/SSD domain